jgi:hypothetical protein
MGPASGLSAQVGFALENNYGVPATPTVWLPLVSETMTEGIDQMRSGGIIAGRRTRATEQRALGNQMVAGDVQLELYRQDLDIILEAMLGGVDPSPEVGTEVFTLDDLPSMTVQIGKPDVNGIVWPFTYAGSMVSSWEVALAQGEIATLGLSLLSKFEILHRQVTDAETTNDSPTITSASAGFGLDDVVKPISGTGIPEGTTVAAVVDATTATLSANATATAAGVTVDIGVALATPTYTEGLVPYHFVDGAVTVQGAELEVTQLTLAGDNGFGDERRFIGKRSISESIQQDYVVVDGSLEAEFANSVQYRRFKNGSAHPLSLNFAAGDSSLVIESNIFYTGETPTVGGTEIVDNNLPFEAEGDDDTETITVVYTAG